MNKNYLILDYKGLRWIFPEPYFHSKKYDSEYKQERKNKTKTYLKVGEVGIPYIFSLTFQKIMKI
jgi:hypothetical protein